MAAVSEKAKLNRESLYRMLSMKGKPLMAHPVPPLNIIVTSDDVRPLSYPKELEKYLNEQGASSMGMHAKKLANMKNTILYASNDATL